MFRRSRRREKHSEGNISPEHHFLSEQHSSTYQLQKSAVLIVPKQGESETKSMSVSLFQPLFLTLTLCFCACWLVIEWSWEEKQPRKGSTHRLHKSIEISREQGQALMENEEKLKTPRRPLYSIDRRKGRCWNKIQKFKCRRKRGEEGGEKRVGMDLRTGSLSIFEYITIMWFRSAGSIFSF